MAEKLDASDPRVQWLAKKVCASLGCDVTSFFKLMEMKPATFEMKETIEQYIAGACVLRHEGVAGGWAPS